ncbi:MAG: radical SAM protein [Candidatus Omnitrophica bacterium]|nr:radical SAM protein [Candidatus Omnitrophota bacterium]
MTQLLLASFLEHKGLKSGIYQEFPYSVSEILSLIKKNKTAALGMTCDCTNLQSCITLADLIKKMDQGIYVILGGVHATLYHRDILEKFPQVDIVVRGEGEETLAETLANLPALNTGIKGITFRTHGAVTSSLDRPSVLDCDQLPNLSYHLLGKNIARKFDYTNKWWPLHTGRGCCYNCTYCSSGPFWKHCYRVKSIKRIIEDIRRCQKEYHVSSFALDELTFSIDRKRVLLFCEKLHRGDLKIEWCCDTRVDRVDKELLRTMHAAGCRRIDFGIESFSNRILKLMNKNYDGAQALEMVNYAQGLGIEIKCELILGFPGETDSTLKETMGRIYRLRKGVFCNPNIFHMYSGSGIYDKVRARGLINDAQWMNGYNIDDFTSKYYSQEFLRKLGIIANTLRRRFKPYELIPVQ